MKFNAVVNNFLTNKLVLNVVSFIALLNVIGYAVMGKFNNVLFFIVLAILVKYFSKNMIIILGVPLLVVNLLSLRSGSVFEGLENKDGTSATAATNTTAKENQKHLDKALDDKKKQTSPMLPGTEDESGVVSSNVKTDESFEVGRKKNAASKIDYATTVEDAYDELNKILGSDGIKRLTSDTQGLMQQQADLAKSMEAMTPLIESIMPMAEKAQKMMESMDSGNGSLGSVMEMAKKMSGGLGNVTQKS
jgi:preprotein translocase subunit SecF